MALAKCFDRTRAGEVDREEELAAATEVRRDSTLTGLEGLRADFRDGVLAPFLEALFGAGLAVLAFKRTGLERADARVAAFFVTLDLDFAFVAISPQLIRVIPVKVKKGRWQTICSLRVDYGLFPIPTAAGRPSRGDFLVSISTT